MNVGFVSLGCPKNQVDLERVIGDALNSGLIIRNDVASCDFVVVNTCGFLTSAVSEAIDAILQTKESMKADSRMIVMGCAVERYRDQFLKELPEVDFCTGVGNYHEVLDYILECMGRSKADKDVASSKSGVISGRTLINEPYYAYLKISEGCNNRCAYCKIPSIRGNLVSRSEDEIVAEAIALLDSGVRELVLVSQDNTKYGSDHSDGMSNLLTLLKKLVNIEGKFYLRLMYMNPDGINDELLELIASSDKILNYFDIPVQHASDKILSLMERKTDAAGIRKTFEKVRKYCEDSFIRTTFIVGFPSESEEDVLAVEKFILEMKPDYAGFFPYSDEDGTRAEEYHKDNPVAESVVKKRIEHLQNLQEGITSARLGEIDFEVNCFVDKPSGNHDGFAEGRAFFQAPDDIDGKLYVVKGNIDNGYGPYRCVIKDVQYPDVYAEIVEGDLCV